MSPGNLAAATGPPTSEAGAAAAAAAAKAQAQAQVAQLLREVEAGSAAYSESLRTHQDALRGVCRQLPKLVQVAAMTSVPPLPADDATDGRNCSRA